LARILLADDEQTMRQMMRLVCERAGHEVHEAASAPAAIEAHERLKPDVLVLDVGMPGGGGAFVLGALRFGGTRRIGPVLVVTGSTEGHADEVRERLGVDRVLLKPFRAAELVAAVAELAARAPKPPDAGSRPDGGLH
jgi:CheY-like chemotaxis protein